MGTKTREEVLQAHLYILNNTDEVIPYLAAHMAIVRETKPDKLIGGCGSSITRPL